MFISGWSFKLGNHIELIDGLVYLSVLNKTFGGGGCVFFLLTIGFKTGLVLLPGLPETIFKGLDSEQADKIIHHAKIAL